MIMLGFVALVFLAGFIVMAIELRNTPDGYEDEQGFHLVWRNDRPETNNITCIWDLSEESGTQHSDAGRVLA